MIAEDQFKLSLFHSIFFFKEGDCVTIQEGTSSTELGILNLVF